MSLRITYSQAYPQRLPDVKINRVRGRSSSVVPTLRNGVAQRGGIVSAIHIHQLRSANALLFVLHRRCHRNDRIILTKWGPTMDDREYLYELALILDSAEGTIDGETHFMRIEIMTAKDIASRLRQIANRMANMVH